MSIPGKLRTEICNHALELIEVYDGNIEATRKDWNDAFAVAEKHFVEDETRRRAEWEK